MSVTYLTSFNKKLYDATAKHCIKSFSKHQTNPLIATYEGEIDNLYFGDNPTTYVDMSNNGDLLNWQRDNSDIIPKELGGNFICKCNYDKKFPQKGHVKGCLAGGMKRRAVHWLRKPISWKLVADKMEEGYLVWVDCDSIFLRNIPDQMIEEYAKDYDICYHWGNFRRQKGMGIESGFVIFNLNNNGKYIINKIHHYMTSGKFRDEKKWDDGGLLGILVDRFEKNLKQRDLTPRCPHINPITIGPFNQYYYHDKGVHWRKHNVNID